jgi:6-phosphogluconolactonase
MKRISVLASLLIFLSSLVQAQQFYLFVGTYTNTGSSASKPQMDSTGSRGIYVYRFDAGTGKARLLSYTKGVCNPSFLTVAPDGRHIYSCTDSRMLNAGTLSAFEFDRVHGRLRFINKAASGGDNPAYVSVDSSGKWAAVANYTGGSFGIIPIRSDGSVGPPALRMEFPGHGVNPVRQDKSHVHSAVISPDQRYLFVQDLGLDRITIFPWEERADGDRGMQTTPVETRATAPVDDSRETVVRTVPGSGPRHLTFGPDGRYAYLVEEMGGMVDVYRYDATAGKLDSIQRIAAHPDSCKGPYHGADIHLSPDGKFLYTTNRSESSIAIFSVDKEKGTLRIVGYEPVFGKEPRNFMLDPTGNWLLAADQESGIIVVYRIDRETGLLTPLKERIKVPTPTCLRMMP